MRAFATIGASLALILGLAPVEAQDMPGRPAESRAFAAAAPFATRSVSLGRPEPLTTAPDDLPDDVPILNTIIRVGMERPQLEKPQPLVRGQSPGAPSSPRPPTAPFGGVAAPGTAALLDKDEAYRCGVVNDNSDTGGFWSRLRGNLGRCYEDLTGSSSQSPADRSPAPRVWGSAEFLLWWVKNGPLPVPLVTTNPDASGSIGALNEPGTAVLFGGQAGNIGYGNRYGGRATIGGWFDTERRFGAEVSGFILSGNAVNFSASSAGGTAPVVAIPFNATVPFKLNPAGETSLNAGNVPNTVTVHSTTYLWGVEASNLIKLQESSRSYVRFLAGIRFLRLSEDLTLTDTFLDSAKGGIVSVADSFRAYNEFYGAQIGLRGGVNYGKLSVEAAAKIAFGVDYEFSNVSGSTTVTNGAFGFASGTTPGGVFAQPSNSGRASRSVFAYVPEAELKVGYDVTNNVRVFVGYDFLYVSDVLRPGNQINRNINPTQNAVFGGTGGVLVGQASPPPQTNRSDFWAHGVTFGLLLRY